MGKGLKLLLGGALFGLMAVFAVIGIKSMMSGQQMVVQDNGYVATQPEGAVVTDMAQTNQDVPPSGSDVQIPVETIELEGEPTSPSSAQDTPPQQGSQQATQAASQQVTPQHSNNASSAQDTGGDDGLEVVEEIGKLNLTLLDPASEGGINGEFLVLDSQGLQVASMSGGDTASFELGPGNYLVKVSANGKTSSRTLGVYANKLTNARFELPSTPAPQVAEPPAKGQLLVTVRAAEGNAAVKSNIYVQKQDGTHVAKTNYDDSADFLLEPGSYKVTVKAEGRKDTVREVKVSPNGVARETFAMQLPPKPAAPAQQPPARPANQQATQQPAQQPTKPTQQQAQDGVLRMRLASGNGLPKKARFVVRNQNGERVANIDPSAQAEIRLPAGTYEVMAGLGRGMRQTRIIDVAAGKEVRVDFQAADIAQQAGGVPTQGQGNTPANNQNQASTQQPQRPQQQGGRLKLYAVSGTDRQPLKVNFTVSSLQGALIQALNDVSYAEISLPPQTVLVGIKYQGMNGQETINVKPGEPTEYTFTVSPNPGAGIPQQQPLSPEQQLMDALQQEILRRTQ